MIPTRSTLGCNFRPQVRSRGFTLVELLIVVAIMGILVSLLMVAVQNARESARRMQCASNIRQLAIATDQYEVVRKRYPPGLEQWFFNTAVAYRGIPLFAYLLPYIENGDLLVKWDYKDPIHNADQGELSKTALVLPFMICPSDIIEENPAKVINSWVYGIGSYGGNGGRRSYLAQNASADGIFHTTGEASEPKPYQTAVRKVQVIDGLSHTFYFGERTHTDANFESFNQGGFGEDFSTWGWWGASTSRKMIGHVTMSTFAPLNYRLPFTFAQKGSQTPSASGFADFAANYGELRLCAFGSNHPSGANFAMADGSTQFITDRIENSLYVGLSTRAAADAHGDEN